MEFEPLTRSAEDYVWAMEQMLRCPGLNPFQQSFITEMRDAAKESVGAFDHKRQAVMMFFTLELLDAIFKCRSAGIGREWPVHAKSN